MTNFERIQAAAEFADECSCVLVRIAEILRGEVDEWAEPEEQATAVRQAYEGLTLEDLEQVMSDADYVRACLTQTLKAMRAHPAIRKARR